MQTNHHKRLAKKILRRFEPTWTGQVVDPTSAVLAPVFTTTTAALPTTTSTTEQQQQLPTTSLALTTSIVPTPSVVQTTAAQPTTTTTTSSAQTTTVTLVTSQSTASIVLSTLSTESTTSTTPLTSSSAAPTLTSSTPVQTTAPATTTKAPAAAATTPTSRSTSLIRTSSVFTDSSGVVLTTIVVVPAPSETPTESATPKSTGSAGTIVGAVAGTFVGLICLIAFVSWIISQRNKRNRGNHDDFDRQSYLRNSIMIPDEPDRPPRGTQAALALARNNTTVGPRPPTMIERKNTYYSHGQLSPQVASFEPGQIVSAPGAGAEPAYPSPVTFAAYTPPDQHHQSELARRPSGARLLNRAPTNGGMYDHSYAPSPVSHGPESYRMQSPDSYGHDGYTYPMIPGAVDHRGMVLSVTPYQAEQYAEITRQLESAGPGYDHDSFHPVSPAPGPASPVASVDSPTNGSPLDEQPMPNPFNEKVASNPRIDSFPPALPPIENLSRTGTPIDPNPQYARWSYDSKAQNEGNRLSVAGMPMPEPPTLPAMAIVREDHPVQPLVSARNGAAQPANRPITMFDADDAYGGI